MGQIAFLFPGQGAQHPGMGQSLYETYPAGRAVMDRCEAIRPGTLDQCFHGTLEVLTETVNTQPCMLAVELAAAAALEELGVKPADLPMTTARAPARPVEMQVYAKEVR